MADKQMNEEPTHIVLPFAFLQSEHTVIVNMHKNKNIEGAWYNYLICPAPQYLPKNMNLAFENGREVASVYFRQKS